MNIRRFLKAWSFFRYECANRNFEEPFFVQDLQGGLHVVSSRSDVWAVAWHTADLEENK